MLALVATLAVPVPAAGQSGTVPDRPARPVVDEVGHDFVTLSWDDPGDATITGYQILRRDRDVHATGEFIVVEDDTASSDTVYTDHSVAASTRYVYRVKARNVHGLSQRSTWTRATTPAEPPVEPAEDLGARDAAEDPQTPQPADVVPVWSAVLGVDAVEGSAPLSLGYSRWARVGSLSSDRFDVDGVSLRVMVLAVQAGGLFLGVRGALGSDFVLDVGGERFVGSQSLVASGLPLSGAYWWPAAGSVLGADGDSVDVSLTVEGTGDMSSRGLAPPGAHFTGVPGSHDGQSSFVLRLNFDEDDLAVSSQMLADHGLAVTGGTIGEVLMATANNRAWDVTIAPDGGGDVTLVLAAATDCVSSGSVCSSDGRMLRNSVQVVVAGPDDYSDDAADATSLPLNAVLTGQIETLEDVDWFSVELAQDQTYQIDLDGAASPYFHEVQDKAGVVISEEADPGGSPNGLKGLLSRALERYASGVYDVLRSGNGKADSLVFGDGWVQITAKETGTYYVGAGSTKATGGYEVSLRQLADDIPSDTSTTETVAVGGTATGQIEVEGDHDWFKVTLAANKKYRFDVMGRYTQHGTLLNPYIEAVYRPNGRPIGGTGNNDGGSEWNARVDVTASAAGTYYLSAGGYGEGTYTVEVNDITDGVPDDLPADTTTTGTVAVGGTATGEIEFFADEDWFKVTLEADRKYYIDMMGSDLGKGTILWPFLHGIHRADGTLIDGTQYDNLFDGTRWSDREVFTATASGVHYVAAGGSLDINREGTYTLLVTDMTPGQADDHPADMTTTGTVAVDGSVIARNEAADDRDWYKVALTAGKVYRFELNGAYTGDGTLIDPQLHGVYDADGELMEDTTDYDSGVYFNSRAFFTPTATGNYFVAGGGAGIGTYTLAVVNITDSHPDDHLATVSTAAAVAVGGSATGDIGHPDDHDWFAVTLEAGETYQFDLKGGPTGDGLPGFGTMPDPKLHGIHDPSGTLIAGTSDDDGGVHTYSQVEYTAAQAGTHYVSAGGDSGTYTLFASALASDDHPAGTDTTGTVAVGGSATGEIEVEGDRDWFAVTLQAGTTYVIELNGVRTRDGTLFDPILSIPRGPAGPFAVVPSDDYSGIGANSRLVFTPTSTGVHYLSAGGGRDWIGTYTLYVAAA